MRPARYRPPSAAALILASSVNSSKPLFISNASKLVFLVHLYPVLVKKTQTIWFTFTKEMAHHWQLATASRVLLLSSKTERVFQPKENRNFWHPPLTWFWILSSRLSGHGQSSSYANSVFRSLESFLPYATVFMIRTQNWI